MGNFVHYSFEILAKITSNVKYHNVFVVVTGDQDFQNRVIYRNVFVGVISKWENDFLK